MKLMKPLYSILFFFFTFSLNAQTGSTTVNGVPFAESFVSRVSAAPKEGGIVLTWKDSTFFKNPLYDIFRHTQEITKDNFPNATFLASVTQGVGKYEDKPGDQGTYYYLVLIKNDQNQRLETFVNFRNKTTDPVSALPAGIEELANIRLLSGQLQNQQVFLTWESTSGSDRSLVILRTTTPVTSFEDLKNATNLGTVKASSGRYSSGIFGGIDFYYTVLDSRGYAENIPGTWKKGQGTVGPFSFSIAISPQFTGSKIALGTMPSLLPQTMPLSDTDTFRLGLPDTRRALPLPKLNLQEGVESGMGLPTDLDSIPQPKPVGPQVLAVFKEFNKTVSPDDMFSMAPTVLKDDNTGKGKGSQLTLDSILKTSFLPKAWITARTELQTLLRLEVDPRLKSRIHFYIGQTYIQEGDLKRAYVELLLAKDNYFQETLPFLDTLLKRMRI